MTPNEIPETPQELPDNPPLESPPFYEPVEPGLPQTPEPEPEDSPD